MATLRAAILEALRLIRAMAPGDEPTADEFSAGLEAAQDLILALHEARGPLPTLDITGDTTPGENQRLRVQAGSTVSVTLPNSVAIFGADDPYDYGFDPGLAPGSPAHPPRGSTGAADGVAWRQPTDGARIEIVGTQQGLYFYRDDTNAWVSALGLTLESDLPLSGRLAGDFAALLAERLSDVMSTAPDLSAALKARVARARQALFLRPGRRRGRVTFKRASSLRLPQP
jgi:hypothetical protein